MDKLPNFHCVADMNDLITKKISAVFENHHVPISPQCLQQLSGIVLNVFNAVEKQHNDLSLHSHIKKSCSEEITDTDISLLLQYDLYQQLDRMKQKIHYPVIKDLGSAIMDTIHSLEQELPLFSTNKMKPV